MTTANSKRTLALFFAGLALSLAPALARAEGAAPAMMGIKEIQVQHTRVSDNEASNVCGSSTGDFTTPIVKGLLLDQLPAFTVMDAPPQQMSSARIDLLPEIVTLQKQGLDCTSWVALTAQSRQALRVMPIQTPRNVTVTYWRGGLMISSTQIAHPRALKEAFEKLSAQFSKQFRLDQPPPLPNMNGN